MPSLILVLLAVSLSTAANAATLICNHMPQIFEFYLKNHYSAKTITEDLKKHSVEQFIKNVDPSKTLLVEADVAKLRSSLPSLFTSMKDGNCKPLLEASELLVARAKENQEFVRSVLGPNYKLDENIEFMLDPKKRGYAKDLAERQSVLRKMVHFQMSSFLLTDVKIDEAKKQLIHRYELITKHLQDRKNEDIIAMFAEAFALAMDPHSSFLSRDNMEDFQIQMHLTLEGIGASLRSEDGFTVIEELIVGGGAEKSKQLEPKDKIMAVAQDGKAPVSVVDMDLRDVVKLIRGAKGTKVRLTILRQGEKTKTFEVTIVRDRIDLKDQAAKITYETRQVGGKEVKVGIIDLPSFYGGGGRGSRSCSGDVKKLLAEAKEKKVGGIVLNLSRNGGGLLEEAVKISGLFLKTGNVVSTKGHDKTEQVLADEDSDVAWNGPLVVLISRLSASASEILAGALSDYHRALIVGGDHTFGKGSVQVLSALPLDLGGMKVTMGMFFLPGGKSTQHNGVSSHVVMPSAFATDDIGEATLDYALPAQSIKPFLSDSANGKDAATRWEPIDENIVKKLAEKSKERVDKEPKFTEIKKNLIEQAKNGGTIKLAELRKKTESENKEEKKKKKDKKAGKKDADTPHLVEAVNILVDLLSLRGTQAVAGNPGTAVIR